MSLSQQNWKQNIKQAMLADQQECLTYIDLMVNKKLQEGLFLVAKERPDNPLKFLGEFLIRESGAK